MSDYCRTKSPLRRAIPNIASIVLLFLFITGCGTTDNVNSLNVHEEESDLHNGASFLRAVAVQDTAETSGFTPELKEWKYAGRLPKGLYDNAAAISNGFL